MAWLPASILLLACCGTASFAFSVRMVELLEGEGMPRTRNDSGMDIVRDGEVRLTGRVLDSRPHSSATFEWKRAQQERVQYHINAMANTSAVNFTIATSGCVPSQLWTAFVLSTNCQDGPTEEVYVQVNLTYAISTNQSAAENDADCDGMPAATTMASSTVQAVDLTTLTDNALSSLVFDILLACPGVAGEPQTSIAAIVTIAAACSASVVFLTAIMILIYLMARKKKREKDKQTEVEKFNSGVLENAKSSSLQRLSSALLASNGAKLKDIPPESLRLGSQIAESQHCDIFVATVKLLNGITHSIGENIVVKRLKETDSKSASFRAMRKDIEQLQMLSNSDYIVKFFTAGIIDSHPCILMEYMEAKDLRTYLRHLNTTANLMSPEFANVLDTWEVLGIGVQAAEGMEYLAARKIVHRHLAAKSVLVREVPSGDLEVKLADLGVSHHLMDDKAYLEACAASSTAKWLSPESLHRASFTNQSDVWSFGMVMWEIATCGQMPFNSIPNTQLLRHITKGLRPEMPSTCGEELYRAMKICWHYKEEDRPTFEELVTFLSAFYTREKKYFLALEGDLDLTKRSVTSLPGRISNSGENSPVITQHALIAQQMKNARSDSSVVLPAVTRQLKTQTPQPRLKYATCCGPPAVLGDGDAE